MKFRACLLALGWGLLASAGSAAVFVVDSTGDEPDADVADGICRTAVTTCTLRAAIEQANALAGANLVQFAIPGCEVCTIFPSAALPEVSSSLVIDGYSQPGASPNTLSGGENAAIKIAIDGSQTSAVDGLTISGGASTLQGLSVVNFHNQAAVVLKDVGGNVVRGNFLGVRPDGLVIPENPNGSGIRVESSGNRVGGTSPGDRNLISGNVARAGVFVNGASAASTTIQGNWIGTDITGNAGLATPAPGIWIIAAPNVLIGGSTPGAGNVIAGSYFTSGILVGSDIMPVDGAVVQGNVIGTDVSGTLALPNGHGIELRGGATNVVIGGSVPAARNIISGNLLDGIFIHPGASAVIAGNWIGLGTAGTRVPNGSSGISVPGGSTVGGLDSGSGNVIAFNGGGGVVFVGPGAGISVLGNSIFDNRSLGIASSSRLDPVPNDPCDIDGFQNHPILLRASLSGSTTLVSGELDSSPGLYRVEFFASDSCGDFDQANGETFLGFTNVLVDDTCRASFSATLSSPVGSRQRISATATSPLGSTSEFSPCIPIAASFFTVQSCRLVDTRNPSDGEDPLAGGSDRVFLVAGRCGVSATAKAVALNLTVTRPAGPGYLTIFGGDGTLPGTSAVNFAAGQTRGNNAVIGLGTSGGILIHVDPLAGSLDLILDISGYFE